MMMIIDLFLGAFALYLVIGLLFSIYFYAKGGVQIDEGVKGTTWHFKLIIFPGVVLFWCVLVKRLMRKS